MPERRALWASTEAPGGIATYVRVMQPTPLWTDWNIRRIVTHLNGSASTKIAAFARGTLMFVVEFIRFRPIVAHAATNTSFRTERDPVVDKPARRRLRRHSYTRLRLHGRLRELSLRDTGGDPRHPVPDKRSRVVAGDFGGPPKMIGGGCGVLVSPDFIEAIAADLRLVIRDHELLAQYDAAACARVADQFDIRSVPRRLEPLYCEVSR